MIDTNNEIENMKIQKKTLTMIHLLLLMIMKQLGEKNFSIRIKNKNYNYIIFHINMIHYFLFTI